MQDGLHIWLLTSHGLNKDRRPATIKARTWAWSGQGGAASLTLGDDNLLRDTLAAHAYLEWPGCQDAEQPCGGGQRKTTVYKPGDSPCLQCGNGHEDDATMTLPCAGTQRYRTPGGMGAATTHGTTRLQGDAKDLASVLNPGGDALRGHPMSQGYAVNQLGTHASRACTPILRLRCTFGRTPCRASNALSGAPHRTSRPFGLRNRSRTTLREDTPECMCTTHGKSDGRWPPHLTIGFERSEQGLKACNNQSTDLGMVRTRWRCLPPHAQR